MSREGKGGFYAVLRKPLQAVQVLRKEMKYVQGTTKHVISRRAVFQEYYVET